MSPLQSKYFQYGLSLSDSFLKRLSFRYADSIWRFATLIFSLSLEISVSGIPSSVFSRMARTSSLEGLTLSEADFISAVSASASVCCYITVSGTPVWDSVKLLSGTADTDSEKPACCPQPVRIKHNKIDKTYFLKYFIMVSRSDVSPSMPWYASSSFHPKTAVWNYITNFKPLLFLTIDCSQSIGSIVSLLFYCSFCSKCNCPYPHSYVQKSIPNRLCR